MRHEGPIRFLAALLSVGLVSLAFHGPVLAQTPVSELNTAALLGPFDETPGHQTFITAHCPGCVSPTVPQVLVHWTFWSDSCDHLADFETCLTLNDSVVLDVANMGGIDADNVELASRFNLSGYRGSWTAHAFETDARCRDPADTGFVLVDHALNGTWSIANTQTHAAFGDRAQGLSTDGRGFIVVPDEAFEFLDFPFFQPDSLQDSSLILLSIIEELGDFPNEAGPAQGVVEVEARARACDNQEACLSLPDVTIGCALFSTLIPSRGGIIPETLMPGSGGFLRLSSPRFVNVEDPVVVGGRTWIYGWHGEQLGPYGTQSRGTYGNPVAEPSATPTSSSTPSATPTLPQATPSTTPEASLTPSLSPTPGGSGSPPTSTPSASPTATQAAPTPSPTGAATPTASPTPVLTLTPAPTGSPAPSPTPSPTPT